MIDELDICRGGVIEVDTARLHAAADDLARCADELHGFADEYRAVSFSLTAGLAASADDLPRLVDDLARRLDERAEEARGVAQRIRRAADGYEVAEWRSRLEASRARGDTAGERAAAGRLMVLFGTRPYDVIGSYVLDGLRVLGAVAPAAQRLGDPWGVLRDLSDPGATMVALAAALGSLRGATAAARATRPRGRPGVAVTPRAEPVRVAPPMSLSAALARVPQASDTAAQVRVERYRMPEGASRFVVYVSGTRTFAGRDPWNMASNVALYQGAASPSSAAVEGALERAGARPGDRVIPVVHSQGALIGEALIARGRYEVPAVIDAGSPTVVDPGPSALSISLRHTDDPVAALAGPPPAGGVGTSDSLSITARGDPGAGPHDVMLEAHRLDRYIETARAAEASGDPRLAAVDDLLADLSRARSIESTDFVGELSPASEGGGRSRRSS